MAPHPICTLERRAAKSGALDGHDPCYPDHSISEPTVQIPPISMLQSGRCVRFKLGPLRRKGSTTGVSGLLGQHTGVKCCGIRWNRSGCRPGPQASQKLHIHILALCWKWRPARIALPRPPAVDARLCCQTPGHWLPNQGMEK